MIDYLLTKTSFCQGVICPKNMYLSNRHSSILIDEDERLGIKYRRGHYVEDCARKQFKDGIYIDDSLTLDEKLLQTQNAISQSDKCVFQATFLFDKILIIVDVLSPNQDSYDIIEIKSTTSVKNYHIPDLAIQNYVLEGLGLNVNSTFICHLNNKHIHPNQGDLFTISDCSDEVNEYMKTIQDKIKSLQQIVDKPEAPVFDISPNCHNPHKCMFIKTCWKDVPNPSIFTIPSISKKETWPLYNKGIITIDQYQNYINTMSLKKKSKHKHSNKKKMFLKSYKDDKPLFDVWGIKESLIKLHEPLYFVDFKTLEWPIPKYIGTKPYSSIPYQCSVHKLEGNDLHYSEFLWNNLNDPRESFIKNLLETTEQYGSIIVYLKGPKKDYFQKLSDQFPEYKNQLNTMINRVWNMYEIFDKYYFDAKFKGNTSLRGISSVILPDFEFADVTLQREEKKIDLVEFLYMDKSDEKSEVAKEFSNKFETNTYAMVQIYKYLKNLIDTF